MNPEQNFGYPAILLGTFFAGPKSRPLPYLRQTAIMNKTEG